MAIGDAAPGYLRREKVRASKKEVQGGRVETDTVP